MGKPAARQGDMIQTQCLHNVQGQPPGAPPPPPITAPVSHPYVATLDENLSTKVRIGGKFVALQGSAGTAKVHLPLPPPGTAPIAFVNPPNKRAEVMMASRTVRIQGEPVARIGDQVKTCSESPPPHGTITPGPGAPAKVMVGG